MPRPRPPTLSGLSVYLDFADFSTFKDYENDKEFSHALKKARMRIQIAHEERLFAQACTGSIYWLKCNGGDMFKEKPQEHVLNVGGAVVVPGMMTPDSWEQSAGQFDDLGPPPMPEDAEEDADGT